MMALSVMTDGIERSHTRSAAAPERGKKTRVFRQILKSRPRTYRSGANIAADFAPGSRRRDPRAHVRRATLLVDHLQHHVRRALVVLVERIDIAGDADHTIIDIDEQ